MDELNTNHMPGSPGPKGTIMSENTTIVDVKSARALVRLERDRSKVVYAEYIFANAVTLETVSAHVKALAELAFPKFDADASDDVKAERKGFMNRVRNGLNHNLGKRTPSQADRAETTSTGDVAEDQGDAGDAPASPVTVTAPTTADLASTAEDVVRALILRAMEGDADAMRALNTITDAIDAAGAAHADARAIAA